MKNELKSFFRAFVFAFRGIIYALRHERNMRFHLCAAVTVTAFSLFYDLTKAESCVLMLCIGSVISAELMNTAAERTADISVCGKENSNVRAAKDCAAGAVLAAALFSAVCGVILFFDPVTIGRIFVFFRENIIAAAGLVMWLIFSFVFVFCLGKRKD